MAAQRDTQSGSAPVVDTCPSTKMALLSGAAGNQLSGRWLPEKKLFGSCPSQYCPYIPFLSGGFDIIVK